jgi:hypothetical protein
MKKLLTSWLDDAVQQTQNIFAILIGIGVGSWLFYVLPKMAAEYVFENQTSLFLRILWFVVVIPVVMAFVWLITSDGAIRSNWIKPNIGSLIVVSYILFAIAGLLFSSFVYLLAQKQWVDIISADGRHTITIASLIDLFMWHFLEAIPSLHINDLLNFEEPFDFDGKVGALVLLFQLSVIFPIIRFYKKIREFNRNEKHHRPLPAA